ncbi:endospore germination permease [Clostridium sp. D2Q-14]|uniref:GerAB/ArcD/ProY family transporter n=1 Tax=Anaeromonas gelatinilytica TaxID=2683194 RepID=UPI00193C5F76|nr:endospore germination permease [Anaeromonas gelatinilytica]MBS4534756.1 endospore germination permease [Anaeromonas gelatinilytica]
MLKNIEISNKELIILMAGFIIGDSIIVNIARAVKQDAWISIIISWVFAYVLIGMYVYIAKLNPNKTLIEILIDIFGKYIGRILSVLYLWYFLHLSSLIFRSYSEYISIVVFPETPRIFITAFSSVALVIGLKYGLETIARTSMIAFIIPPISIIIILLRSFKHMDITNIQPVLEYGMNPILKTSFGLLTFPFGEAILFLMIFTFVNKKEKILKSSFISITFVGVLLIIISLMNIMVLGPEMINRNYFNLHRTSTVVPGAIIDPFITVSQLVLAAIQIWICIYSLLIGITQLFNLNDYKPFVIPIVIISVSLSNWLYNNVAEMFRIAQEIYPYYAIPFQFIIPIIILIISLIKQKGNSKSTST